MPDQILNDTTAIGAQRHFVEGAAAQQVNLGRREGVRAPGAMVGAAPILKTTKFIRAATASS